MLLLRHNQQANKVSIQLEIVLIKPIQTYFHISHPILQNVLVRAIPLIQRWHISITIFYDLMGSVEEQNKHITLQKRTIRFIIVRMFYHTTPGIEKFSS